MERAAGAEVFGCGSTQSTDITLNIQTTTGGNFSISISAKNTVEHLKKVVSKKLKVSKDRICLLHRERQLREGTLEENGLFDGSRVILLPSVETGLLSQKPENSVMQALESLNDSQVNDFLSGKSPLNLTMRLGDHMMLIQLQLSTLSPGSSSCSSSRSSRSSVSRSSISSPLRITPKKDNAESRCPSSHSTPKKVTPEATPSTSSGKKTQNNESTVSSPDLLTLQNAIDLFRSIAEMKNIDATTDLTISNEEIIDDTIPDKGKEPEQTPIKSLSNMVSSPIASSNKDEARNENALKHHSIAKAVEENIKDLMDTIEDSLKESGVILEQAESKTTNTVSCLCDKDENKSCDLCFSMNSDSSNSLSINDGSIIVDESLFSKDDSSDFDTAEKSFLSESIYGFTDHSSVLSDCTIDEYPVQSLYNDAIDVISTESLNEVLMEQAAGNLLQPESIIKKSVSEPLPETSSTNKKRLHCLLHKDAKLKITSSQKQKAYMQSLVNKQIRKRSQEAEPSTSGTARTEPYAKRKLVLLQSASTSQCDPQPSTSRQNTKLKSPETKVTKSLPSSPTSTVPDTKALIEASKNLTQTLKKLSKEVLTNKVDISNAEEIVRSKIRPGAVIESMKHHGKGIYSGTFSGTLNPALQDRYGRPKRDISTIIHILNDLLCATPPISVAQKDGARGHACGAAGSSSGASAGGGERKCACACPHGECAGHQSVPAGAVSPPKPCPCDTKPTCQCPRAALDAAAAAAACHKCDSEADLCHKCQSAKTLALENSKTKCKLDQLRLVMQQKKEHREARKLQARPYTTPSVSKVSPPEPATVIPEEIDTLA